MMTRLRWPVAALAATMTLSACTTSLRAPTVEIRVTPKGDFVAVPAVARRGEAIIRVENHGELGRELALLRLDDGDSPPTTDGGVLDLGTESDLTYRGDGYTVVAKLDRLRRHISGRPAPSALLHEYFSPGVYLLVDVEPGRYDDGAFAEIRVRR